MGLVTYHVDVITDETVRGDELGGPKLLEGKERGRHAVQGDSGRPERTRTIVRSGDSSDPGDHWRMGNRGTDRE